MFTEYVTCKRFICKLYLYTCIEGIEIKYTGIDTDALFAGVYNDDYANNGNKIAFLRQGHCYALSKIYKMSRKLI